MQNSTRTVALHLCSPTGGTRKAAEALEPADADLAVVAMPVFGGRIPAHVVERLKTIDAEDAPASAWDRWPGAPPGWEPSTCRRPDPSPS